MQFPFQAIFGLLADYLRPQRWRVLLLALLLGAGITLQLINPQIIRYVLDTARAGAPVGALVLAALLFTLFGLLQAVAGLGVTYVGEHVSWTATNALRSDLALHCLRLGMNFHNSHTPGELMARIDGDVGQLGEFFSHLVLRVIANGLLILGVIGFLFREDWRMGAAALLYALLTVLLLQSMQRRNVRNHTALRAAQADLNGYLEERLAGREDMRANGGEEYVLRGMALVQRAAFTTLYRARMFGVLLFASTHLLFALATALGFGLGIYLFLQNQITIGAVYLIVYYLTILRAPLEQIRDQVEKLQRSSASIGRIRALQALKPTVQEHTQVSPRLPGRSQQSAQRARSELAAPTGVAVRFENVSFRYRQPDAIPEETDGDAFQLGELHTDGAPSVSKHADESPAVLNQISFSLAPGQILGLLGRTGSGKSTLTRLLFRLYDPDQGAIYLDGKDIRQLPQWQLRSQVGMVTQEVQLFQASLRQNITLFNPDIEDDIILTVLEELGLWNWYASQPDGLDTMMQASGQSMSAGEAQLLAFVRVFLKDPGLVILDEASSRLDPATELLLERAADRLLQGRTGIVIAHRLGTVQRADLIMVLEQGRVAEFGPRAALAADVSTRFSHLLQTGLGEQTRSGRQIEQEVLR